MKPRAVIDASKLPDHGWDSDAPLWWGNLLLIFIETSSVALLLASYFYIRRNFWEWPPPRVSFLPHLVDPNPYLGAATIDTILVILACVPMYWTDMAARKKQRAKIILGLGIMLVVTLAAIGLRWHELRDVHFRWDDNAYASCIWWILGLHLFYLITTLVEFGILFAWGLVHPYEDKHALDVTLMGGFWYWVAGMWAIIYVVLWWYPRWS